MHIHKSKSKHNVYLLIVTCFASILVLFFNNCSSGLQTISSLTNQSNSTSNSDTTLGSGSPQFVGAPSSITLGSGNVFHIRADGGTATQCNGKANMAYPGTGSNQNCAWVNPMIAMPPRGPARISGGDTLIIHSGQYKIGYGAPIESIYCNTSYPWDCEMSPVPSGIDANHPTQILGEGFDSSCPKAPQLYGAERVNQVLNLVGSNNVQVACLEITDHSQCIQFHSNKPYACNRDTFPYGEWTGVGLRASDSQNVRLDNLNIHGLASTGVYAGRLTNWTSTNIRIAGNGGAGWDGDIGASNSSNQGTIYFSKLTIEWNGCGETYPGNQPYGCWGQSAGGYGDGLGTAKTGGNWVFEDSYFKHNVSDGLDLLYADGTGSVTLRRVWSEGNAGNQIKISGTSSITNTVVLGNCGYFHGKAFTYNVDDCRAFGDAVALAPTDASNVINVTNSTLVGEGNVIILGSARAGVTGAKINVTNSILIGLPYFLGPSQNTADMYTENATFVENSNLKQGLRNANCSGSSIICGTAGIVSTNSANLDPHLLSNSAAIDSGVSAGSSTIPTADYAGIARPKGNGIDRGAFEF